MNLKNILIACLCAMGLAFTASAGSIDDTDGDLIPDVFDNCRINANGPADATNQVDTNGDGFGNACDGDFNGDLLTNAADFTIFASVFLNPGFTEFDLNNDGVVDSGDFTIFVSLFLAPPGPGASAI